MDPWTASSDCFRSLYPSHRHHRAWGAEIGCTKKGTELTVNTFFLSFAILKILSILPLRVTMSDNYSCTKVAITITIERAKRSKNIKTSKQNDFINCSLFR